MSKRPHRTRPLDRDGDGHDGGSLPGNETAPMATGDTALDSIAEAEPDLVATARADHDMTCESLDPAADEPWERDNAYIADILGLICEGHLFEDRVTADLVAGWSDEQARQAQEWAEAADLTEKGELLPPVPDFLAPLRDRPAAEDNEPDPSDTFTPEEVAAGRTPVIEQEGEATTTAADTATVIDPADPLVTVDTDTAPVAVRLSELGVLVSSRRLYRTPEGYTATYSAPFIDEATVNGWIKAGLAECVPTAGNIGGVRATAEARSTAARLRREQQAEAA